MKKFIINPVESKKPVKKPVKKSTEESK